MRREALALVACGMAVLAGCSRLERLSIVKPTAERGDWTQVASKYDVSDKGRKAAPLVAAQLLASATEAYRAGKLTLAAQQARQALKSDPKLGDAHTLLAGIASAQGDQAAAGKHYQQAVAIAPATGAYANNYGTWLCGNGRAAESLDWFDRALADPGYATRASAFGNAGTCAKRVGLAERAEANWRQALALLPVELQSLAGMAGLQFDRGRYLEARAFAERWLAVAPADAEALQLAASIEQKLGDNVAAGRYLSRLQVVSSGSPAASPTQ
jgi:type IV pilus assembly protein PilF